MTMTVRRVTSLRIEGYRPFRDFTAQLGPLEVLVGANGSGKTALFEFLKFLRDSVYQDIPPEIVAGSIGQEIFHIPGPARFAWSLDFDIGEKYPLRYQGELTGPVGQTQIREESVEAIPPNGDTPLNLLRVSGRNDVVHTRMDGVGDFVTQFNRSRQFALSTAITPMIDTTYALREYLLGWRFYSTFRLANEKIRRPVPIEQEPTLHEDVGNLSAVLFYLLSEHRQQFDELQGILRTMIPGFQGLSVKARGRGEVIAFWLERGIDRELSLADLSDGTLRVLCWAVLCVLPNPPTLICIDEPDQGIHPRALPLLAGLFQKASERTQIIMATHDSYFLTQFRLEEIAVLRKQNGESVFAKPADSQLVRDLLNEFGTDDLEYRHRSEELEQFS
jgi:predicted ATPase